MAPYNTNYKANANITNRIVLLSGQDFTLGQLVKLSDLVKLLFVKVWSLLTLVPYILA
jgi:hypothetical protein